MAMSGDAGFLIDTNVISEATRAKPDMNVLAWLATADEDRLFLSVATIAEISYGIDGMPTGAKRKRLHDWLHDELMPRFDQRILSADAPLALRWGSVVRRSKRAGHQIEAMDALIAATAEHHNLTLATRNAADFAALSLPLFDPWSRSADPP
jgi:toxin FitB